MGTAARISDLSLDDIRRRIDQSNCDSHEAKARYVYWENRALHADYEFIDCPCEAGCWCRGMGCAGHYRIKKISFDQFLNTYVLLWIPKNSRNNIKSAVLEGQLFNGRQRNAVPVLQWLGKNWSASLARARDSESCGLCEPTVTIDRPISNLYEAKMWSQLFYDVLVPFDTASKREIKRAGYETADFSVMNKELFRDLRRLAEAHGLDVPAIRRLDSPFSLPSVRPLAGGQPLSRVIDKIFYSPKTKAHKSSSHHLDKGPD